MDLKKSLRELQECIYEYNHLAKRLAMRAFDPEYVRQLNLLEERILLIKQSLDPSGLINKQNQEQFLQHHFAAVLLINQHINHLRYNMEHILIDEELEDLKNQMENLLTQIHEQQETIKNDHPHISIPIPVPTPSRIHHQEDD